MSVFEYKGLNKSGNFIKGSIKSESLKAAKQELKKQGIFLQEIAGKAHAAGKKPPIFRSKKVSTKELAVFTRLLSSLLRSGVPLVEALDSISQQMANIYFRSSVSRIRDQVNEGRPFHSALSDYPAIFDDIYISLCESGEASGSLDEILEQISILMEKRASIQGKMLAALFYPGILFALSMAVMIVLCVYVIPNLMDLFEDAGELPWMTKVTLGLSNFLVDYWLMLIVSVFFGLGFFFRWKKTPSGKKIWDVFIISVPIFGRLIRAGNIAMFSKVLSALLKGGVPVLKSMDIVKNTLSNTLMQRAVEKARENIKEGESIVDPLERSGQFPPVVLQMIRVGERTGSLENMLDQISLSYDRQVELEISAFTSILGPMMILLMAGIIVFILLSVLLPMLGSFDALGV